MQHLKAYASTEPLKNECIDPRFKYVARNCAEVVEWLGQKENPQGKGWASGAGYGEKIIAILKAILTAAGGTAPVPTAVPFKVKVSMRSRAGSPNSTGIAPPSALSSANKDTLPAHRVELEVVPNVDGMAVIDVKRTFFYPQTGGKYRVIPTRADP